MALLFSCRYAIIMEYDRPKFALIGDRRRGTSKAGEPSFSLPDCLAEPTFGWARLNGLK